MAKRGELEKAKEASHSLQQPAPALASQSQGIAIVESKHCGSHDLEVIKKTAGQLLQAFSSLNKEEKERLAQRTVESIKKNLNSELGGNWNVIMGKDLQISVGLTPQCRLFRIKSGTDRLFCFESYTKVIDLDASRPEKHDPKV